MIRVRGLVKEFRVHEREAGLKAAIRSVFRRKYQIIHAIDDISFEIEPGERVGFLGPNGAGKTTTLKVLSGLLHPTSGVVEVNSFVPKHRRHDFLRGITLVMGQKNQLIWDLPAVETYELNRAIYGVSREAFEKTYAELDELLEIGDLANKPTRQLSLGERMKCELVAALLHTPTTLFLDEPTIGLDVSMQAAIREFVRSYNERNGATVLLTSHYMEDVAALCPRVIVIDKGRLIYDGALENLAKEVHPEKRVSFTLSEPVKADAIESLGEVIEHSEALVVLRVHATEVRSVVSHALGALPVADLKVEDAPLEEVMRSLFAKGDEDETDNEDADDESGDDAKEAPASRAESA